MIHIDERSKCCGCGFCSAACPHECIKMMSDAEGFLYPDVDEDRCTDCGKCEAVCPNLNGRKHLPESEEAFLLQHKDEKILHESTSGGAFTAIAKWTIEHGGVVCGVCMGQDLTVRHIMVEDIDDLKLLRNSKYVQSVISKEVAEAVRGHLDQGQYVCFSGAPCQTEGLALFLNRRYDKLILVDVVCRAVASPLIFSRYIEYLSGDVHGKIRSIRFRDKHYGYDWPTIKIETEEGILNYHRGIESDPYLRAFFSDICDRPSCYGCIFRGKERVSDFTIWDCLRVCDHSSRFDNGKGTSRIIIRTGKAKSILRDIENDTCMEQIPVDEAVKDTKEFNISPEPDARRGAFFEDALTMDGKTLFDKYFPISMKCRLSHTIRKAFYRIGLYSVGKKCFVRSEKLIGQLGASLRKHG